MLVTALPSALCGAEPDSSQFGFLSTQGRTDSARHASRAGHDAASDGATLTDGSEPGKAGESGLWDVVPEWLHLELGIQSLYDDNIFLTADDPEADWITRVTPAFRASSGAPDSARWVLGGIYDPTWTTYASSSGRNSFDQALAATIRYNGSRLRNVSTLSYRETTGNDRFVRGIFETTTSRADVLFNYALTEKTSLETRLLWQNLDRERSGAQQFNNEETLSGQVSALWQATGKTRLGPSLRAGTTSSTLSPDRTFVDMLVRADYESTDKLSFAGEAGVQWISYDGNQSNQWVPSASLSARYTMNPSWQLLLNGYSRTTPSVDLANTDIQATGVNGSLIWTPGSRFRFSAGAGYESATYEFLNGDPDRPEDYTYGEVRAAMKSEGKPWSLDVFYRHRLIDSDAALRNFENNQAGASLTLRY